MRGGSHTKFAPPQPSRPRSLRALPSTLPRRRRPDHRRGRGVDRSRVTRSEANPRHRSPKVSASKPPQEWPTSGKRRGSIRFLPIPVFGWVFAHTLTLPFGTLLIGRPHGGCTPLDQLRTDESNGGASAKERGDNGESVHSSAACRVRAVARQSAPRSGTCGAFRASPQSAGSRPPCPAEFIPPWAERSSGPVAKSGWPANSQHATPPDQPGQAVVLCVQLFTGDCRVARAAFLVAGKRGHE